jgi:TldD protein
VPLNKKTNSSSLLKLRDLLKFTINRSLKFSARGQPKPYYASLLVRNSEWFSTYATCGSTYKITKDRSKDVFCDIRVGSYHTDQIAEGGLHENSEERDSYNYVSLPVDDNELAGLKHTLWKLTEYKFKEALTDYQNKESQKISRVNQHADRRSFTKLPKFKYVAKAKKIPINEKKWIKYTKTVSAWLHQQPQLITSWVDFDSSYEEKFFINSEEREILQYNTVFSLSAYLQVLTKDGEFLDDHIVITCGSIDELPTLTEFKSTLSYSYKRLMNLMNGLRLNSYSGPVLLASKPAGLLLHEAIGHRLEGNRLLAKTEGQTFKDMEGKRILNVSLSIIDDPTTITFENSKCIGSYLFDDEGTPAERTVLIENGILKRFLTTRSEIPSKKSTLNGHARNRRHQRPISRMAVTMISGEDGLSSETLRKMLIQEIIQQDKEYGVIVYETSSGETETSTYDFQAFAGEIRAATLLYRDGKEVPLKGVNIVGTPLQALSNIIAYGNELTVDNSYCGAESGTIPITTISPSLLLRKLELQAKEYDLVTQFTLPPP